MKHVFTVTLEKMERNMIFEVASLTNDYDSASQRWLTDTDCPITVTMVVATDPDWKIVINSWKCSHFPIFPSSMRILDVCNNLLIYLWWVEEAH